MKYVILVVYMMNLQKNIIKMLDITTQKIEHLPHKTATEESKKIIIHGICMHIVVEIRLILWILVGIVGILQFMHLGQLHYAVLEPRIVGIRLDGLY